MLEAIKLRKSIVYFDIEEKKIARIPTESNYKSCGADNSLYFGIFGSSPFENVFEQIFNTKKLSAIDKKIFELKSYDDSIVKIQLNINHEGQIQLKFIEKRMIDCYNDFILLSGSDNDKSKYLMILDFSEYKVKFKPIKELVL